MLWNSFSCFYLFIFPVICAVFFFFLSKLWRKQKSWCFRVFVCLLFEDVLVGYSFQGNLNHIIKHNNKYKQRWSCLSHVSWVEFLWQIMFIGIILKQFYLSDAVNLLLLAVRNCCVYACKFIFRNHQIPLLWSIWALHIVKPQWIITDPLSKFCHPSHVIYWLRFKQLWSP